MNPTIIKGHSARSHRLLSFALAIGVSCSAALFAVSAAIGSTTPFTSAETFSFNPNTSAGVETKQVNSSPPSPASTSYSTAGFWGEVSGTASANLQTGQLKGEAINSAEVLPPGTASYMQTNSTFGDGFRTFTTGGTPFSWQPNSTANFSINLSGSLTTSGYTLNGSNSGAFAILTILKHDTLTPASFTDPAYDLTSDPNVLSYYVYELGNPSLGLFFNGHPLNITQGFTSLPSQINQTFHPNGDFDWWVLLGAAGQVFDNQSYDFDLAHTLTLNYIGPSGSTTNSVSGLFQNFGPNAVPEPATLALLGIGLAGIAFSRRKQ